VPDLPSTAGFVSLRLLHRQMTCPTYYCRRSVFIRPHRTQLRTLGSCNVRLICLPYDIALSLRSPLRVLESSLVHGSFPSRGIRLGDELDLRIARLPEQSIVRREPWRRDEVRDDRFFPFPCRAFLASQSAFRSGRAGRRLYTGSPVEWRCFERLERPRRSALLRSAWAIGMRIESRNKLSNNK
jgi:hypothetical protein